MQLDEFVKTALTQICEGVEAAIQSARDTGAIVSVTRDARPPHIEVQFDVAVTTQADSEKGGQGGIRVCGLDLHAGLTSKITDLTTSRIRFCVPLALPTPLRR